MCSKVHITEDLGNNTFEYQWFDGVYYTVTIPDGYYDLDELNAQFKLTMASNKHYLEYNATGSKIFLMNIAYNTSTKTIALQSYAYNTSTYSTTTYSYPTGNDWSTYVSASNSPSSSIVPVFYILDNAFQNVIGISTGKYPSTVLTLNGDGETIQNDESSDYPYSTDQISYSTSTPQLLPMYSVVYYKPNNSQYAQQGAVSASSLITRLKELEAENAKLKKTILLLTTPINIKSHTAKQSVMHSRTAFLKEDIRLRIKLVTLSNRLLPFQNIVMVLNHVLLLKFLILFRALYCII